MDDATRWLRGRSHVEISDRGASGDGVKHPSAPSSGRNATRLTTAPSRGFCKGRIVVVTIAFMLAVNSRAIAQTNTGEVSGVVRDISGGVLPGATVTARHVASGLVVERVT